MDLVNQSWPILRALRERTPHALLVHGPRGVGKLGLAERFAQLLLCEAKDRPQEPCGRCPACRWFAAGNHPDVRFVEPEAIARHAAVEEEEEPASGKKKPSTEIRVEQVRALADFLNLASHRGRVRVAIVHPAEDMNAVAANALLKSLEEPPAGALFLLVSHRPARLLPTIRSRCVALPVAYPDREAARAWLEGQGARDAGRWLAYAGGAPARALELASGPRAAQIDAMLAGMRSGDRDRLGAVTDREDLELLAEALQKFAIDNAVAAFGAARRYGTMPARGAVPARRWLEYARAMGRNRALARHPLNPKLFAAQMIADLPE